MILQYSTQEAAGHKEKVVSRGFFSVEYSIYALSSTGEPGTDHGSVDHPVRHILYRSNESHSTIVRLHNQSVPVAINVINYHYTDYHHRRRDRTAREARSDLPALFLKSNS